MYRECATLLIGSSPQQDEAGASFPYSACEETCSEISATRPKSQNKDARAGLGPSLGCLTPELGFLFITAMWPLLDTHRGMCPSWVGRPDLTSPR